MIHLIQDIFEYISNCISSRILSMARSKLLLATPKTPYIGNLSLLSSISYGNIIKNELNLNDPPNSNNLPYL